MCDILNKKDMASQQQIEQFRKKFTFMYVDAPPQLDGDHDTFVKDLNKEETPEKMKGYRDYIQTTFRYYGQDTIDWVLGHEYAVISSLANDTRLLNMHKESKVPQERKDLIKLMSPAMQFYAFPKDR